MNNIPVNIVIRGVEALESIANSLSALAEDTKAKNRYKESVLVQILIFILGIIVGCMLFQLGIDLLR